MTSLKGKAIRIHEAGGPEAMRYEDIEVGAPGEGQVRLQQTAIGLNYIDVYHRSGVYPLPDFPTAIGMEAAGVVESVGPGVNNLKVGDRVAYASAPIGSYTTARLMPADRLVKVPDGIDDKTAASMMLQGMTTQYLIHKTYKVTKDTTVLFHAAAGGVGLIAMQWLKAIGATVIGTVGSDEKAKLAQQYGCTHTINYNTEDFPARVKELTDGEGVDVVYDSVGAATFEGSLKCIKPFGLMVTYGNASGKVPAFDLNRLGGLGSLFVTRPTLFVYTAKRKDLEEISNSLFQAVLSGKVKIEVNQTYPLSQMEQAHRDLEARKTTGSTVIIPDELM